MSVTVTCPNCHQQISVEEALSQQVKGNLQHEMQKQLEEKQKQLQSQLELERHTLQEETRKQTAAEFERKLVELEHERSEREKKLDESRKLELELRKKNNHLEEEQKEYELKVQRQLDSERQKIEENALKLAQEQQEMKLKELQKQLEDVRKANSEMSRKISQGSQQMQGEVLELELESMLKKEFPNDSIVPIAKGVRGADILQHVIDRTGAECGTILWELKNAQWSDKFIDKLRADQRESKADLAVLVSIHLPQSVVHFTHTKGIWISSLKVSLQLAHALRIQLHQVFVSRQAQIGKGEKMGMLYEYISSTQFKQRIEAIVDTFISMQKDLETEKRWYAKKWSKQERDVTTLIEQTMGMHGDLSSIMGASLPEVKQNQLESGVPIS